MNSNDYVVNVNGTDVTVETMVQNTTGDIISSLIAERKRQNLTQQDIADATGMKTPNVTRFESKRNTPTINVLCKYAEALGKKINIEMVDK